MPFSTPRTPDPRPLARPDAVLFDLDGTLVDSLPTLSAAMNDVLAGLGRRPIALKMLASFVGDGIAPLVERALLATGGLPQTGSGPVVEAYLARYERAPAEGTPLNEGCLACLEALSAAGLRLAVCTNKPERVTQALLRDLEIERYFAAVVGGDTCATRKPDPEPAFEACRRLGIAPARTAFVGDNEHDAACGRAAGCASVIILEGGYLRVPLSELDIDRSIASLSELAALFGLDALSAR